MRMIVAIAVLILLSGCAELAQQQAKDSTNKAMADCDSFKYKTAVETAHCYMKNAMPFEVKAYPSDSDIIHQKYATMLELSEKVDKKEITKGEAAVKYSEKFTELTNLANQRAYQRQQAQSQYNAQRSAAMQQLGLQLLSPPATRPQIHCTTSYIGNYANTNCY